MPCNAGLGQVIERLAVHLCREAQQSGVGWMRWLYSL